MMASTSERNKDDCDTGRLNRNMRRSKPQQQFYKPGSGPLRRSANNVEETESDTGLVLNARHNYDKQTGERSSPHEQSYVDPAAHKLGDTNVTHKHNRLKSEGSSSYETDVADSLNDLNIKDDGKRRPKKPDQTFYIPKPVAQALETSTSNISRSNDNLSQVGSDNKNVDSRGEFVNGSIGSSTEHLNIINTKSKRYSNRRRPNETNNAQPQMQDRSWRSKSPPGNQRREIRQGSEPRLILHQPSISNWNRWMRDTRSVEPTLIIQKGYGSEKSYMKPPSGRRHSTVGLEVEKRPKVPNFDALPPRFRKKYIEDNRMNVNYIGTHSEGSWDGNSLVFQGTSTGFQQNKYLQKHNYSLPFNANLPRNMQHHNEHHVPINYPHLYYTLPHRGRGRSRLNQDGDNSNFGRLYRCTTPDRINVANSSPLFSDKSASNEHINRTDNRASTPEQFNNDRHRQDFTCETSQKGNDGPNNQNANSEDNNTNNRRNSFQNLQNIEKADCTPVRGFRESLEAQLSPVSPATPEPEISTTTILPLVDNRILDWSEEVELQVRLEAEEAFSDAVTRSSSMTSLVETSTTSQPSCSKKRNKRKNKRSKKRSRSRKRDNSLDNQSSKNYHSKGRGEQNRTIKNSYNSIDLGKDVFKVPENRMDRRRRNSRDKSKNASRESSFDRGLHEPENWREEILQSRHNSERETSKEPENKDAEVKKGGIIILPNKDVQRSKPILFPNVERPKYPDTRKPISPGQNQKSLFDPNNPSKPIIVKHHSARANVSGFSEGTEGTSPPQLHQYKTDQYGNIIPTWYDETSEGWKTCHYSALLRDVKKADYEMQCINNAGLILVNWSNIINLRRFLMDSLEYLLSKDLKFCQTENVEQHFWKILYYNIIEMMRKVIVNDSENRTQHKEFVLKLIDEGTNYFEKLLNLLEQTNKFKFNDFLGQNTPVPQKGLGYVGLALISAQKIFIFLGDLARYGQQIMETTNYGICRQWYIKAHEINPKNGKPYNQLAVLALYSRRKLDAVYYYMRSLMSSNPILSAKENLYTLFDENRKKYEQGERKRREERMEKARQHMKEKESECRGPAGSLRREIWIRPDGGRRVHRTTPSMQDSKELDSEEEDLASLSCLEVNKRFVTSYLHVHGKLITKIGMESFHETSLQMLKEFRALLQHSPIPLNCNRFLQLLALNMFAIESTQLRDSQLQDTSGYRSELQERALIISLQMFNLILERCISILSDYIKFNPNKLMVNSLHQDLLMLLPAVKTWCDWMLCHSSVWNPPPFTQDYRVGPPGDVWSRLASLMNLLEKLDNSIASNFISELKDGYELVRLPEDLVLSGFTPLMYNEQECTYAPKDIDPEISQFALRLSKVHFFGTVFLCGLETPVLKLEMDNGFSEYISVVNTTASRDSPPALPVLIDEDDLVVESFSEDEDPGLAASIRENASLEVQELLARKMELEKEQRMQELHRQRVKKILQQATVSVQLEIKPKILVPDTNCFIDYLDMIKKIVDSHVYTLMVPLIVLSELEGLARGGKCPPPLARANVDPIHALKVADSSRNALEYLKNRPSNNMKCVTTKGTMLPTFTFTLEEDSVYDPDLRNDDKILLTCLGLCKNSKDEIEGEPKKLHREVVLLTEDRNLRVKAMSRDLPVRKLPDFMQWAGLG